MKIDRGGTFTFTGLSEKESRNLRVLDLIRAKGTISRTDISKDTGINIVSISNYMKDFLDNGLLHDKGPDISTGGRKPELMELASGDAGAMGISIKGPEASVVVTDLEVKIVDKKCSTLEGMAKAAGEMSRAARSRGIKISAIGIGMAESNDLQPVLKSVSESVGAPFFTGDNVCCAAFGEKTLNAEASFDTVLYVHSSRGECVLIKECEILKYAGTSSDDNIKYLRPWGQGLSAEAMAKAEVAKGVGTKIVHIAGADIENINEGSVIEALKQGDEVASGIIESVGINLGLRIAYLINIFAPKVIVIGGGIERAKEAVLSGLKRTVGRLAHSSRCKGASIVSASLGSGGEALGASALAVRELFLRS
jgi:predicted NBD/HSP70 family sugar kinase